MDIQSIVGQLLQGAAKDPESLKAFGVDPAAAIKGATGLDLTEAEVNDVVKAVEPLLEGKDLNIESIIKMAGDFLGNDPGALLGKLDGLFGGGDAAEATEKHTKKSEKAEEGNPLEAIEGIAEGLLGGLVGGK
ncbi:MAG: hypothetical protein RSD93_05415 [Gordonibacter sp.]|uniref:hypothetical protein n=1 Tax=Gordonibacter sp. TaxID=1968902 RepID=UPI002FCBA3EB